MVLVGCLGGIGGVPGEGGWMDGIGGVDGWMVLVGCLVRLDG